MKRLILFLALTMPLVLMGATNTTISSLPQITTPSTNSYLELSDMSATPKSRKIWLLDLAARIFALSTSTPPTNVIIITNSVTVLKGGHVTITNSITLLANGTFNLQNLPLPAVLVVGTNGVVTNANLVNMTLSNDGTLTAGGSPVWRPVTTLAFSTTNVTVPLDGGTNFVVTLTNGATGYFTSSGAPAAATTNTTFTLTVIQDATGARLMNWDTNVFKFQGGFIPATTNANAEDVFTISASAKTAGKMNVTWAADFR